jgi:hypothetical protein
MPLRMTKTPKMNATSLAAAAEMMIATAAVTIVMSA